MRCEWYDGVVRLTGNPLARLNRSVAVGEADGAQAGFAALAALDPALPALPPSRPTSLHERKADPAAAARLYADAALSAPNPARTGAPRTRQAAGSTRGWSAERSPAVGAASGQCAPRRRRPRGARDRRQVWRWAGSREGLRDVLERLLFGIDTEEGSDQPAGDHHRGADQVPDEEPEVVMPIADELTVEPGTEGAEALGDGEEDGDRLRPDLDGKISLTVR